jgi:hypothetical protein
VKTKTQKDPRTDPVFQPDFYARTFEYARNGLSATKIAEALGVSYQKFKNWYRADDCLKASVKHGRSLSNPDSVRTTAGQTFLDYVYDRLSPDVKRVWDQIEAPENDQQDAAWLEDLLAGKGERFRQRLFVHALVSFNFNPSEACKRAGVTKSLLDRWVREDPDFAALVREVEWHERNFIKGAFYKGVAAGEASLIKIGMQAKFRDEGFGGESESKVSGLVGHVHVTADQLLEDVPLEKRQAMLDKLRQQRVVVKPAIGG